MFFLQMYFFPAIWIVIIKSSIFHKTSTLSKLIYVFRHYTKFSMSNCSAYKGRQLDMVHRVNVRNANTIFFRQNFFLTYFFYSPMQIQHFM